MTQIPDAAVQAAESAVYKRHEKGFLLKPLIDPVDMRAALTAAIPHLPLGFEVKKLEWVEASFDDKAVKFFARPDNIDVQYYIIDSRDVALQGAEPNFTAQGLRGKSTVHYTDNHKTIDAAKAAAQADFERRVRECHVPVSITKSSGCVFNDLGIAKPVDVTAVCEVPVNIDKLIAELKSSEDICFSWARSALLANELNALDTEEAHIDLYQALCRLGNVMAYVQSELSALSAEPAQGAQSGRASLAQGGVE